MELPQLRQPRIGCTLFVWVQSEDVQNVLNLVLYTPGTALHVCRFYYVMASTIDMGHDEMILIAY